MKILVGGNHDFYAAEYPDKFREIIPEGVIYLCESRITINGINIWGSPYHPDMVGWAFGEKRGKAMKEHWNLIPIDVDILITHTPPFGILDKSRSGKSIGCEELRTKLDDLQINYHLFGHVHASYGRKTIGACETINA